ncbi:MAG: nuclear transport factor 2 family protein, partial [Pseudomonadales bacterium]|nr:nuclear transport factor 2 family protein [Pseudomonadales bacterium]
MMDKVEARLQIERIIYRYAEAIDTGDLDSLASLFERGAIRIQGQQASIIGGEAVKNLIARFTSFYDQVGDKVEWRQGGVKPFTRHITSNLYFEKLEDDEAVTQS